MMFRRLNTTAATAALGLSFAGARGYHTSPTSSSSMMKRFAALPSVPVATAAPSSSSPGASFLSSPRATNAAVTQMRRFATRATAPSLMRVQGHSGSSVTQRDVPQTFGGDDGGSQADSLTPYVREHLMRVYSLLATGCGIAGVGSFLMIATSLAKVVPFWLPMVAGFVPLLWLSFKPPANPNAKLALFYSFTLLEGMAIAPLVLATSLKGVLVTSLVLTAAIFCGFSAAAYLSPRASLVKYNGLLFGGLIAMVALSFLNIFYPSVIVHSLVLYGGLALFSCMIAVDTQTMIERARCGAGDAVQDALMLFLDVLNIFIHIAQIMGMSNH